jgi:hypothetical protein
MNKRWFSVGSSDEVICANCDVLQKGIYSHDHHPCICPNCKIDCFWYDVVSGRTLQIIPEYAPNEIKQFIQWAQSELDELEFLELIVHFEQLSNALK